ncbi:MAG: metallophosphoesterase family protein [Burkholderiales bacterium]
MKHLPISLRAHVIAGCALAFVSGCVYAQPPLPAYSAFVVLGEHGRATARVITDAAACPNMRLDRHEIPMRLRAGAETIPLRATRSASADSKPSAFPVLTCEVTIPDGTTSATVYGNTLPLPTRTVQRIVVIGDTGCRLKKSEAAYQACNDERQYPFARIAAQAAEWKPDLVIHVGDYLYRENRCPDDRADCAGSPWGYGWDAWQADFFRPAAALLSAAPWIMARGNHESCSRAGQGWWRFLDPQPLIAGRDCNKADNDFIGDYSDPYAVPIGGSTQILVLDTSNTINKPIPPDDIRAAKYTRLYRQLAVLARQSPYNIGVDHHPLLGFAAEQNVHGTVELFPGNRGLQSVFSRIDPDLLPHGIQIMLSGHVHVWEALSFSSPHPAQFIAGFSGTQEDTVPLPSTLPADSSPAPGAVVSHFSSWVNGFGYMTMERNGPGRWEVKIRDMNGKQMNACHVTGNQAVCDIAQVSTPQPDKPAENNTYKPSTATP